MLFLPRQAFIYFYSRPVDLRKGSDGLTAISNQAVQDTPENAYFIFLNRKRNRMKILHLSWHNLSYWFYRSRKGVFAPKKSISSVVTENELQMILKGNFPSRLIEKNE